MWRRITSLIEIDLKEKMVLLAGPRQSGKTTIAEDILSRQPGVYYNWDIGAHRRILRNSQLDESAGLWVFDELHKFRSWRNWLKGTYDLHKKHHSILVTGSARLDLYRRGGDSLQGRYYFHRLHPFTLSEFLQLERSFESKEIPTLEQHPVAGTTEGLRQMLEFGGFPEPLLSGSSRKAARWRNQYSGLLIREDVRDLERIQDLDKLEMLYERLPDCVGSVLSVNSLREDLEVSFPTVRNWIQILERTYGVFRIPPTGSPRLKAVKKEQKLYLWDWGRVEKLPSRLENLVAVHLLRLVHWIQDIEGLHAELRYFRTTLGHEVDFLVMKKNKPWIAVEVKLDQSPLDRGLRYLLERIPVPYAFQVSLNGTRDYIAEEINGCRIRVLPVDRFLLNLP